MSGPLFGLSFTLLFYLGAKKLQERFKSGLLNPLLVSSIALILFLSLTKIPYETYNEGGKFLTALIGPATVCLAIPLYKNMGLLKKHRFIIAQAITVAILTHAAILLILVIALELDRSVMISLIPISITTAFAKDVSLSLGGIPIITVCVVIVTGIVGATLSPLLNKAFKIKSDVAIGLALGTSSHAVGTSKAIENNEIQGTFSSLGLILTGIFTVILAPFILIVFRLLLS